MIKILRYCLLLSVGVLVTISFNHGGWAYGPNAVTSAGGLVRWSGTVTYHLEDSLVVRGKDLSDLITSGVNTWPSAPNTNLSVSQGSLGVDIDTSNVCDYLYDASACPDGPVNDGLNPIVVDDDGSIIAMFFGASNQYAVLGFAGIVAYNSITGTVVKGEGVFNAACLTETGPVEGCGSLSFSDEGDCHQHTNTQ